MRVLVTSSDLGMPVVRIAGAVGTWLAPWGGLPGAAVSLSIENGSDDSDVFPENAVGWAPGPRAKTLPVQAMARG